MKIFFRIIFVVVLAILQISIVSKLPLFGVKPNMVLAGLPALFYSGSFWEIFPAVLIGGIFYDFNDSEFRTSVFVGEKRIEAIFKGQGLESAILDLVPAKAEIVVGDRIITSGLDKKMNRGLYIGEVKETKKVEGKVFQDVTVELAFDWSELEQVLIVK